VSSNANTVFITGFPGFIASRLLRRLAQEPLQFLLLVQPALAERARSEVLEIGNQANRVPADFQLLEGDITKTNLGLSSSDLQTAVDNATIIFHLAALYDLAVDRDPAMLVNLEGTKKINNFARSIKHLNHYHYISTCYVAGKRKGCILETELRHDAGFRNNYEESKYLAEIEVEKLKSELPITIHRPAVVCGDSVTGETAKYDGIYYLIHYLAKWPSALSLLNIGNREVRLNLVPVDFVVESLARLIHEPEAVGKTLQLADPNPLTTEDTFNVIAKSLVGHGSGITVPARLVEATLMSPPSPAITGLPHYAVPYFFLRQIYDTSLSQPLLKKHGFECPRFESYVKNIVNFALHHPKHSS
jgi:thioester reductase-like protein